MRDRRDINKTIVDYTSPTLSTPVTHFPSIGDAAYRQCAGGGPSNGHRQHAQKLVKNSPVVPEISSRTDRHTDRHTHDNTSHATAPAGEVNVIVINSTKLH